MKSRRLRWAGHAARVEESRCVFTSFTGEPTGKINLGKPRRRWDDNFRMDFKEIAVNTRILVDSAQDKDYLIALVNAALNLWVS